MAVEFKIVASGEATLATNRKQQTEERVITPYDNKDMAIVKEMEMNKHYYNTSLNQKITLIDDDFVWMRTIELGDHSFLDRYSTYTIIISDGDELNDIFKFDFSKVKFDLENNYCEFSVDSFDVYAVIAENENDEINIFDGAPRKTIIAIENSKIEFLFLQKDTLSASFICDNLNAQMISVGLTDTQTGQFRAMEVNPFYLRKDSNDDSCNTQGLVGHENQFYGLYAREVVSVLDGDSQSGWTLLSDGRWAKGYNFNFGDAGWIYLHNNVNYDYPDIFASFAHFTGYYEVNFPETYTPSNAYSRGITYHKINGLEYRYDDNGEEYIVQVYWNVNARTSAVHDCGTTTKQYEITYTNAVLLKDAIKVLFDKATDGDYTDFDSNFFASSYGSSLYLLDKYDMMNPTAETKTSVYKVKPKEFLQDLRYLLGLNFVIRDNRLIVDSEDGVEPLSSQLLDLTTYKSGIYVQTDKNYNWNEKETFNQVKIRMNNVGNLDWLELNEKYNTPVVRGREQNIDDRIIIYLETDIRYLYDNNISAGEGIALCYISPVTGKMSNNPSIFDADCNSVVNGVLSLAYTAKNLTNHRKPVERYTLQNYEGIEIVTSSSRIFFKVQEDLPIIYGNWINQPLWVRTNLGLGLLKKVEMNLFDNQKRLTIYV